MIPPLYEFVLLALASYRIWRLLAEDEVLEVPRRRLVRLPLDWVKGDVPRAYRDRLAAFITCAWCLGAWISLAAYIGWMLTLGDYPSSASEIAVSFGVWFALSCVVGIIRVQLDPAEE